MNAEDAHTRPHPTESEPRQDLAGAGASESGLDFLALSLNQHESADANGLHDLDGEHRRDRDQSDDTSGQRNENGNADGDDGGSDNEDADTGALERELVALLSQATSTGSDSHSESVQTAALPDASSNGDISTVQAGQSHEQYLSGLAAVLQAIHANGAVKDTPSFHSLTADSAQTHEAPTAAAAAQFSDASAGGAGGNAEVNGHGQMSNIEFSDLLARITAQLEQAGGQPPSQGHPHGPGRSGVAGPSTSTTESLNFLPHAAYPPEPADFHHPSLPSSLPGPSGSMPYTAVPHVPYYTDIFGTSTSAPEGYVNTSAKTVSTRREKGKGKSKTTHSDGKKRSDRDGKEKKVLVCDYCPKTFGRKSDMLRHMKIHTGDRPFVCPHEGCGKNFIQRSALHVHLRVHSGEKPHMCEYPLCGRTFSDSSSLARHRRTHTGRRPYACNWQDCTKTFTRRTALTQHMRTHDPNWEPDPNVRYNFKPKKRKTDGGVEEVDDEDEEGEDVPIDPALEESVRTLSALLTQTTSSGQNDQAMPSGPNGTTSATQEGTNTLEARVAAISAEIAAAIAQANIEAQLNIDDDDEDEEEDEESDEDEEAGREALNENADGLDVSATHAERPSPYTHLPFPASQPTSASGSSNTTVTELTTPASAPSAPSQVTTIASTAQVDEEAEIDFYVPLRERKRKPTATSVSVAGSKRKR